MGKNKRRNTEFHPLNALQECPHFPTGLPKKTVHMLSGERHAREEELRLEYQKTHRFARYPMGMGLLVALFFLAALLYIVSITPSRLYFQNTKVSEESTAKNTADSLVQWDRK
jgi:hypothetical protein